MQTRVAKSEVKCLTLTQAFPKFLDSDLSKISDPNSVTPWRLGGFGDFCKKNSSFRLPYQRPSSSANCARELFNGSNGSASLVDYTRKKIFAWGMRVFCD